jgi:hypothetical protein
MFKQNIPSVTCGDLQELATRFFKEDQERSTNKELQDLKYVEKTEMVLKVLESLNYDFLNLIIC